MFTEYQLQILAAMFSHPGEEFYLSELGRILGKPPGVFQRAINSLDKQSIVISRRDGNRRLFKINDRHPFFNEFRNMARKTRGAEAKLGQAIQRMKEVRGAWIYGSYAHNKLRPESDIDLLIVADSADVESQLLKVLPRIEQMLRREINYKLYTVADFRRKQRDGNPFLKRVLASKPILLKGDL